MVRNAPGTVDSVPILGLPGTVAPKALICAVVAASMLAGCDEQKRPSAVVSAPTQPSLKVTTLKGNEDANLAAIIGAAKECVATLGTRIWPEPAIIEEREAVWNAWFKYRERETIVNGQRVTQVQLPGMVQVEIDKLDLSSRIIPGR